MVCVLKTVFTCINVFTFPPIQDTYCFLIFSSLRGHTWRLYVSPNLQMFYRRNTENNRPILLTCIKSFESFSLQRIMEDSFRTEKLEEIPYQMKWEDLDERRKQSLLITINYEMKAYDLHSPIAHIF